MKAKTKKDDWKPTSPWIGIPILLAPFLIMLYFSQGLGLGLFCLFFGPIYIPVTMGIMWSKPVPATCHFCGAKKVTCMFQTSMGSIYHACEKHTLNAQIGSMNFAPIVKRRAS
jgi:hypothetical protein